MTDGDSGRYSLFSYRTMFELRSNLDSSGQIGITNYNSKRFNTTNFRYLLKRFYKDIVGEKYGYYGTEEIRPNDTRHFAFCSLMLQGVDPLTIARLGGHTRIDSQFSYQQHTEFFVDCEVYRLSQQFLKEKSDASFSFDSWNPNEIRELKIEGLRAIETIKKRTGFVQKMKIGYCTDEKMDCESENCWECSKWWISLEELEKEEENITYLMRSKQNGVKEKIALIEHLRRNMDINSNNGYNPDDLSELKKQTADLHSYMQDLARLQSHIPN